MKIFESDQGTKDKIAKESIKLSIIIIRTRRLLFITFLLPDNEKNSNL